MSNDTKDNKGKNDTADFMLSAGMDGLDLSPTMELLKVANQQAKSSTGNQSDKESDKK
ncbi:TPA: hypothetical protein ACJJYX_004293 [Enterobacter cloacae]